MRNPILAVTIMCANLRLIFFSIVLIVCLTVVSGMIERSSSIVLAQEKPFPNISKVEVNETAGLGPTSTVSVEMPDVAPLPSQGGGLLGQGLAIIILIGLTVAIVAGEYWYKKRKLLATSARFPWEGRPSMKTPLTFFSMALVVLIVNGVNGNPIELIVPGSLILLGIIGVLRVIIIAMLLRFRGDRDFGLLK
jgi:hypothetical protein